MPETNERGDRGVGRHAVDHEGHGRRDDGRDDPARGDQAGGGPHRITVALHHRQQDGGERGGVGECGAAHAGHQDGGADGDEAEPAADVADPGLRHLDDAPADAAGVHQLAGEDEERDGQQREAVDAGDEVLRAAGCPRSRAPRPCAAPVSTSAKAIGMPRPISSSMPTEKTMKASASLLMIGAPCSYSTSDSWSRSIGLFRINSITAISADRAAGQQRRQRQQRSRIAQHDRPAVQADDDLLPRAPPHQGRRGDDGDADHGGDRRATRRASRSGSNRLVKAMCSPSG